MSNSIKTSQRGAYSDDQAFVVQSPAARNVIAVLRILLGFIFFWAFLDKLFGFGFSTASERAWINGGAPAQGFMKNLDPAKPLTSFFASLASPVSDFLFMLALLGIGLALILGIGLRVAAVVGSFLMAMMWLAEFPLVVGEEASTNPLVDSHIIYLLVIVMFALIHAGDTLGLGRWWKGLVGKQKWLI